MIFSEDPIDELRKRRDRKKLFIGLVKDYYPNKKGWDTKNKRKERAELLYQGRNPLVHSLGIKLVHQQSNF